MVPVDGVDRARTLALILLLAVAVPSLPVAADDHVALQVYETLHGFERQAGAAVAWHGETLLVGAPGEDRVEVMRLRDGLWRTAQTLEGPEGSDFGASLAVHGDLLVVGAPDENPPGPGYGAAHAYRHTGSSWSQLAHLTADDGGAYDFGFSVDVDGDWIAVGAPYAYIGGSTLSYTPSVHLFQAAQTTVRHVQTLSVDTLLGQRWFGHDVDLDGARLLVGAPGNLGEERIDDGSAFLYVRSGTSWTREATLERGPLEDGGGFGIAVALTGDQAIVCDDYSLYVTDNERALHVYKRSGGSWSLSQSLFDVSCDRVESDGERMVAVGSSRPYLHVYGPSGSRWSELDVTADASPASVALGGPAVALGDPQTGGGRVHLLGRNVGPTAVIAPVEAPRDMDGDGVERVTLDGTGSEGGDGDKVEHFWYDQNDRLLGTGATLALDFAVGTHPIRLAVSDPHLGTDVATVDVEVLPPPPPVADFSWLPVKATVDEAFRFVDESTSEYGHVVAWSWDMDGDGDPDATGPTPSWTFDRSGRHDVTLTVRTDIDTEASATKRVTVRNLPPVAQAGMDQILHDDGDGTETVELDASASSDRDGKVERYAWTRDGRRFSSSATTSVRLGLGVHDIDLTVTDDRGATDTDRVTILVLDGDGNATRGASPPDAAFSWKPTAGPPEHAVALTDASSDRDGRVVMWWYDVGADGSYEATEPDPVLSTGGYGATDIQLTVTDDDGRQSKVKRNVFLKNEAPTAVADARATDAYVGQTVVFVDNSTDPEGALQQRNWDFGDGKTSAEQAPAHVYKKAGTYEVVLTVTDDGGKTATDTLTVTVRDVPPGQVVPAVAGSPFVEQADDSPLADATGDGPGAASGDGDGDATGSGDEQAGGDGFQATAEERRDGPVAALDPARPWLWLGVLAAAALLATLLWVAARR